ncbi:uncharacterized protein LOC125528162 [Triticum urartu]|uniref:Uncharacterized protein n=1 Tax=Triticum urartu TaxID=4572 RepID=A0A8R7P6V7_TRIUA|nr:uncharacterized protein LOC119334239 [Triticum dicoccoides]XP_048548629.1 uncharacterized protein LOC125528162 [Triticum urartu]
MSMGMDSPQKKLGSISMDGGKTPPLLLEVAAQLAKKAIAASPFPDAHRLASAWAFVSAWFFPVSIAFGSLIDLLLCSKLGWCHFLEREWDRPIDSALWIGLWCCPALQAAVAALALLLPSRHRRIRRALAYLAVSVAIVGHSLMASLVPLVVAAYPGPGLGYLLLIVLFVCAAAALAQLLPCLSLRIRRALAHLALAIVGLCILASLALAADTAFLILLIGYSAVIFTLAVGDLLSFLALLLGGEEE